jgi:hypothetical protein
MPTYKRGKGKDAEEVHVIAGSAGHRACLAEGSGWSEVDAPKDTEAADTKGATRTSARSTDSEGTGS